MEVTRRAATVVDRELARRIHYLAYREVVERQFGRWNDEEQDAYFDGAWPRHRHDILEWHGTACGYVAVEIGSGAVDVHELVLHPAYQNRGIGTHVLLESVSRAQELGLPVRFRSFSKTVGQRACTSASASNNATPRQRTD